MNPEQAAPHSHVSTVSPGRTRRRLWVVLCLALLVLCLGLGLAVREWQNYAAAERARLRESLENDAQRMVNVLQGDLRELHLLLRAVQLGIAQRPELMASQEGFASSVALFRPDLLAMPVIAVVHLAWQGRVSSSLRWVAAGGTQLPPDVEELIRTVRRKAGDPRQTARGRLLAPVSDDAAFHVLAVPVLSENVGLTIALVRTDDWIGQRFDDIGRGQLMGRMQSVDGASVLYRDAMWPDAVTLSGSASAHLVSPAWRLDVVSRDRQLLLEGGRAAAMAYVLGGALLAALILFLGGQREWLQERVVRMTGELASSRARLQRALAVTREGVGEYASDTRRFYCSDRLLAMLGLEGETAPNLHLLLRPLRRQDRRRLVQALRLTMRTGGALDEAVQLASREGPERWLRVRALAPSDAHGKVLRVTAAVSDISGTVAQRLQLERYKDFLHGLMDAMPVPLSVKDENLNWVVVNQAFCDAEQRRPEDLLGKRSTSIAGERLGGQLEEMDRAALQSGARQVRTLWQERPDGSRAYLRVSKIRCVGPDGRPMVLTAFEDMTQLQQEQETQAALHAFYQNVFDALPHPVFVKDEAHRYVLTNRAHAESRGCSKEDIVGKTAYEHAPPDVARAVEEAEVEMFAGRAPAVIEDEYGLVDPQGRLRRTMVRKVALQGLNGRQVLVGINTDISELRDMEDSLRAALHRFSILFENAPLGIALIDYKGSLLDANPYFLRMTGYSRAEILGVSHRMLSPPREHELDEKHAASMIEQGYCEPFAKHYVRKDGQEVPVMVSGVVVREGNRVSQIWGLVQDTSERDSALAALQESEARWQFALEGSGDAVWDWDVRTDSVFYSPRWKTMLGYDETEIGDSREEWRSRIHPDDLQSCLVAIEAHMDGRAPLYASEHRLRCKSGSYKWILDRGKVIERDAQGKATRLIGTQTDITDRRAVEDEVRQHRDRLAELVREQTDGLVRAKEEAERALEAKSVFLANMSHELRTPMHAVLSFANLGESRVHTASVEKLQDYFNRIRVAGERLMHLLNDLLDLSKFEAGRMGLELRPVDLQQVVVEVAREFEAWLAAKRLTLQLGFAPDLPLARADAARSGQLVRNLLSNAVKFTPEGKAIMICLQAAVMPDGRGGGSPAVELVVADTGPGVPEEELESVFEKFVQSSATRTGAGGTGLGLAICREIVLAQRGRLFARNRPEGGAEFIVILPAVAERPADSGLIVREGGGV